jgi:hypothetical protein
MSDMTDHLEDQIEAHRANVEDTLDKLRGRLSVDQVVDDIGQIVGVQDLRGTLALTGRQMRENPLALGLIGIGLAWLLIGRGPSDQGPSDDGHGGQRDRPSGGILPAARHQDVPTQNHAAHDGAGESLAETVVGGAAEIAGKASALAHDLADQARHAASGVTDRVKDLSADATHRMHAGGLIKQIGQRIERQPLLLGGVALIAGAVIGAALPRTRTEDRLLGASRSRLLQEAREGAQALKDRIAEASQRSYDAAVKAAEDEGLAPLDNPPPTEGKETVAARPMDGQADQAKPVRTAAVAAPADTRLAGVKPSQAMRSRT